MKRFFSFIMMIVIVVVLLNAAAHEPETLMVSGVDDALWPNSPAGRCAKAYIKAYQAQGDQAMRRFIAQYRSPDYIKAMEEKITQYQGMRKQIGKLDDGAVKIYDDYDIAVIARSTAMGLWLSIRFKLEADPPHYLAQMAIMPTTDPNTVIKEYTSRDSLSQLLEKARNDAGAPAMAAAVVRGGKIMECAVAGVREYNKPEKAEINDRFHVGSVTKAMTATMIGKLVEDKILRWDMKIGEVLHGLNMKAVYRDVSLEQLLSHRGGLPPYTGDKELEDFSLASENLSPTEQRAALVVYVLNRGPAATPGEKMLYSNAGYVVAAYMAESITKKSWEELMLTLLFEPLGFRSAGFG